MVVGEGARLSTGGISASRPRSRSRGSSPACCTASRRPIRCPSSSPRRVTKCAHHRARQRHGPAVPRHER